MKASLLYIQTILGQLLFGERCCHCHTGGTALCQPCALLIPFAQKTGIPSIEGIFDYGNSIVHDAIWSLKYHHRGSVAKKLVKYGAPYIQELLSDILQSSRAQQIFLVPIPQYKKRYSERGFNQSEQIAHWISVFLKEAVVVSLLEKYKETLPQAKIKRKEDRLKNVRGSYRLEKGVRVDSSACYILIDDVTTTGATFLEGMRVLKDAGAKNVSCIALAHGYKDRKNNPAMIQ